MAIITKISSSTIQYVSCCEVRRVLAYGENLQHRSQQQLPKEGHQGHSKENCYLFGEKHGSKSIHRTWRPTAEVLQTKSTKCWRRYPYPSFHNHESKQWVYIPPIVSSLSNAAMFHRTIIVVQGRNTSSIIPIAINKKQTLGVFFKRYIEFNKILPRIYVGHGDDVINYDALSLAPTNNDTYGPFTQQQLPTPKTCSLQGFIGNLQGLKGSVRQIISHKSRGVFVLPTSQKGNQINNMKVLILKWFLLFET